MSRTGKIARLPHNIRDQLNRRLQEGESGPEIVAWVNEMPECRQMLAERFSGRPIDEGNLSEWRHGGYEEWLRHEDRLDRLESFFERVSDMDQLGTGRELGERLGSFVAAELAEAVQALEAITDPNERWRRLQEISRELSRFRRENCNGDRLRVAEKRWEFEFEQIAEKDRREGVQNHRSKLFASFIGPRGSEELVRALGHEKDAKKWADWLHRLQYDLPLPDWWHAECAERAAARDRTPPTQDPPSKSD
jgi:hypothetical protein